ncbi:MAG: TonB family protein [Bacteroidota bacterium]
MAHVIKADWDEMLFESRERSYGAYALRKHYARHLFSGLGIMCFLFITGAALPGLFEPEPPRQAEKSTTFILELLDSPLKDEIPEEEITEPDLPPPVPPQVRVLDARIPEPAPINEIDSVAEIASVDSLRAAPALGLANLDGALEGVFDGEIDGKGVPDIISEPAEEDPPIDMVNFAAEEPQTINMNEVRKMIGYPELAKNNGIEGMVVIRILVDKYGNYKKHKVIKKIHPLLSKACEAHLSKLRFTPAIQGGNPIPFWVNIPFRFILVD